MKAPLAFARKGSRNLKCYDAPAKSLVRKHMRNNRCIRLKRKFCSQRVTSREEVDMKLVSFFESKPKKFYEDGIKKLVGRWKEVIDKNGDYTDD